MNDRRKEKLNKLCEELHNIKDELDEMQTKMQEEYDDMSEKIQDSEKGELLRSEIDDMEEYKNSIQQAIDGMEAAYDEL